MCLILQPYKVKGSFILLVLLLVSLEEGDPVIHTGEETEAARRCYKDIYC